MYVAFIAFCAAACCAALYMHAPVISHAVLVHTATLALLAVGGEALTVLLPRSANGSMAFIPFFALAIVVPAWPSVIAVAIVRCGVELWNRRAPIRALFNVSSQALTQALAIALYLALGGKSLVEAGQFSRLLDVTSAVGLPALVACIVTMNLNHFVVAGVIAISSRRSVFDVWRDNSRGTIGADILSAPLVFIFAWVYASYGVIATATLWIPMLGLRQLQRTNLQLEKTNQELLELMVKSLEARDAYTSGHSRRVQRYSITVARAIGLSEKQLEQVSRAALLHDVGKIHEKYAPVLSKTEKLSAEEWALIQEHAGDGADLVGTMSHLSDIVPAIRHHHENWDGTGYPDGLAGHLIPLPARIIRFADTIDAMTTQRPYRAPLTEPQVRAELVSCRGSQFDPEITDRLLSSPLWSTLFAPAADVEPVKAKFAVIAPSARAGSRVRRA